MTRAGEGHWADIARRWDAVGPPLRPGASDIAAFAAAAAAPPGTRRRTLVLGATPELADAPWPAGTEVWAIDHQQAMIAALWPGAPGSAVLGDWTRLPVRDASLDLVVCDGGFHLLDHPGGQASLAAELARTIAPGGRFAVRLFLPSPKDHTVEEVLADLAAGSIPDANHLKVRLWMAVRRPGTHRVALDEVWQALHGAHPDLTALAGQLGWDAAPLLAFETYRGSAATYDLVGLADVDRLMLAEGAFERDALHDGPVAPDLSFPTAVYRRLP